MVLCAYGPQAEGSRETPFALENRAGSRNAAVTSRCRDSAQKSCSSLRYSGASARSRA